MKTQVISSGFLWGFGDVTAQYITHSTAKPPLLRLTVSHFSISFASDWTEIILSHSLILCGFIVTEISLGEPGRLVLVVKSSQM